MASTQVIKVGPAPDEVVTAAAQGAKAVRAGGLVAFATETVYGIAAAADSPPAMERLRQLKSRPDRPFTVHIARRDAADRYVADIPTPARRLMRRAWPGPVTMLLPTGGRLADEHLQQHGLYDQLCRDGVIGLRCPKGNVAETLLSALASPVVAPSANLAGAPSPRSADDVLAALDGRIDLLLDSGPARYGKDSTIVRFGGDAWTVLRQGVYDERTIRKLMRRRMLFVCTGNTCRSPMAAGLARQALARHLRCTPRDLPECGVEVLSAGVFAADGFPPSPEAVAAAARLGADISGHRSRKVTSELIHAVDVVFCMTDMHVATVRRLAEENGPQIERLDRAGDVPDPIGAGPDVYVSTAERIQAALVRRLDEGLL